ncbi:acetyltransferase [Exiguobacterium sp. SH3S2]|uniref:acetyltransferase n=1 Tax=unclassified Exiguobacterium TaxID=2644629 RepID=UPI00103C38CF|nr:MULTISPECIES: acetyltransferase [unclassified Exiguobacterium]TCI46221.1 acetyltransferase [Exiguobacterium sp. SH3S3]TCI61309.1 acetyltransferase [Exiguobacterium sp. SH3S2]
MKKLLIIGASGHGKVVANIAHDCNEWDEIAFIDDDKKKIGSSFSDFKVIDVTKNVRSYVDDYEFVIGIGDADVRERLTLFLKESGAKFTTLIHPSVVIGLDVKIEQGTVIMPGCIINSSTIIKESCIINTASTINHDCEINKYAHISPGSHIAGNVSIGEKCWVGIGSSIVNDITIVDNCTIGAGAVVVADISQSGTYVGIPAKIIHSRKSD